MPTVTDQYRFGAPVSDGLTAWCEGCRASRHPDATLQCDMCGKTGCTQCVTDTGLYRVCDECLEQ